MRKVLLILAVGAAAALMLIGTGCSSKADVASSNISKAAEQFQVYRRIIFINGITDKYLFVVQGFCSVETTDANVGGTIEVTCKEGTGDKAQYFRDNLGLSDNVTFMIQQLDKIHVSDAHYRVLFRPETIVPNFTR